VQCRHLIPPNPAKPELTIDDLGTKFFPRLRSEKEAPSGQLSKPKLELQLYNRDKPEITNYKHQMTNKFQITISKSQIGSTAKSLGF
jgi:hypothetical protein